MKVVFFGTPQFAIPSLEALLKDEQFKVEAVVSQPDKRRGRGSQMIPSPIKELALDYQLPVLQPERLRKDLNIQQQLKDTKADFFVVVAYGQILPPSVLAMPRLGCINLHGSILPQYRGAAPIQWSIYYGDKETGITTMLMDEGMDTGAILLKSYLSIGLLDNAEGVSDQLAKQGSDLLKETLLKLNKGEIDPIIQDNAQASYAPLIKKADYLLDWSKSAESLHNQVRGFFPDCQTSFRGNLLKVFRTVPVYEEYFKPLLVESSFLSEIWPDLIALKGNPGQVMMLIKDQGLVIQTGEGLLLLQQVQLSGKRLQSAWDFANGMRIALGEQLA